MFDDLKTVSLKVENHLWHGCKGTPSPEGTAVCELIVELARKIDAGERVYFGVTEGEYAGSIFYFELHENFVNQPEPNSRRGQYWQNVLEAKAPFGRPSNHSFGGNWQWNDPTLYGRMRFVGRKNKPMFDIRVNGQAVYLPDYDGETIYKKFDKKAAGQAIKEEIEIRDRNGEILAEGDKVIYVNLRYGSGGQLDYGTIKTIKVKAKKSWRNNGIDYEVNVVIKNRDADEESTIRVPQQLIIKE